jgi:hypothetical protein
MVLLAVFALVLFQCCVCSRPTDTTSRATQTVSEIQSIPIGVDQQKPAKSDTRVTGSAAIDSRVLDRQCPKTTLMSLGASLSIPPTLSSLLVYTHTTTADL